jgi:MoaA/NifB/PqqE/SkfB family radical SAM enzyme
MTNVAPRPSATHTFAALPMPAPDRALYDAVLEAGFRAFPERKANFERFRSASRSEVLDYLPIKLDVENVSRCNFRCTMCQVSDWPKQKRADDMSFADFKALLDTQIGLTEIKLQGMGEPLLGGDTYFDMVEYARARHLWVRSTNNGSLLHLKDNYKRLIDSDICEVQLSVDGATRETFEKIRRGGKFDMVTRNLKMLNAYGRERGRLRTRMWVVLQKENHHELALFPRLAAELGFERLTFSLDLTSWGQEDWRQQNDNIDVAGGFDIAGALALVESGRELGVEVTYWFIDQKFEAGNPKRVCPWPFERGYVSSDMRFVPCCMVANPEISDLGDARALGELWNGETLRDFRRRHLAGDIPAICRSCYADTGEPNP